MFGHSAAALTDSPLPFLPAPRCDSIPSRAEPVAFLLLIMSSVIETIERAQLRRVPEFLPGDRVKVHFQVIEGTRRRVQVFEGVVIKRQGHGVRETFTVRKQSFGIGVERSFPLHSPKIERIEVAARGDVRRAKLYYLRDRVGKRARVRERRYSGPEAAVEPGLLHEQPEADQAVEPSQESEMDAAAAGEAPEGVEAQAAATGEAPEGAETQASGETEAAAAAGEAPDGVEVAAGEAAGEADASPADAGSGDPEK